MDQSKGNYHDRRIKVIAWVKMNKENKSPGDSWCKAVIQIQVSMNNPDPACIWYGVWTFQSSDLVSALSDRHFGLGFLLVAIKS